ncbi:MAG: undecaprenyl-diphosphate phosphatase [Burkholderiales bacterium]|nr:undecaprenyl-diphosphate phosphatase [Burkholderiales bacterium]
MEIPLLLKAFILGIVEGLTEFLPISSTGHLILAGALLDFDNARGKAFYIIIQAAAMLAVCWEYRAKIGEVVFCLASRTERGANARQFAFNVAVAFVPAALLGLVFASKIKMHLFAPVPVALAFIVGGIIILWAERREHTVTVEAVDDMRWTDALKVGFAQCVALIPGMSRSGATIIGGLLFGLSRKAATEFSFFLAIPTLFAATVYELFEERAVLSFDDAGILLAGGVASFISAFIAVRALLRYISRHDFTVFAWYRIVFGIVVLITAYGGIVEWTGG